MTYIDNSLIPSLASRTLLRPDLDSEGVSDVPLKGEVCTQYIRCNKPSCRCQEGAPHGPYYYRVWREGGRVHKEYVKSADVAAVRAACETYKTLCQQLRNLRHQRAKIERQLDGEWRKTQRLLRSSEKSKPGA